METKSEIKQFLNIETSIKASEIAREGSGEGLGVPSQLFFNVDLKPCNLALYIRRERLSFPILFLSRFPLPIFWSKAIAPVALQLDLAEPSQSDLLACLELTDNTELCIRKKSYISHDSACFTLTYHIKRIG